MQQRSNTFPQHRPPRIVALADDLTGGNALGAMLAEHGYRVETATRLGRLPSVDAFVLDTGTRDLSHLIAALRARRATRTLLASSPGALLAKRIDSAFRGSIVAEVTAMLGEMPARAVAVVCPALPVAGRTVVDGILRLPPEIGGGTIDLRAVMMRDAAITPGHLSLATIRSGPDAIAAALQSMPSPLIVADAQVDGHVGALADALSRLSPPVLPVDPGGLTAALAARIHPPPRRVVALVGSRTPQTVQQLAWAASHFTEPTSGCHPLRGDGEVALARIAGCSHRICMIHPAEDAEDRRMPALIARAAVAAFKHGDVRGLFLSGGSTARMALRALGARGVAVERQIAPLVALGRVQGGSMHGLPVITKGGMVGDVAMLARCLEILRGDPAHV